MDKSEKDIITCPLCNYEFEKKETQNSCANCPLNKKNCGLLRCPNCGHEFPEINDKGFMERIKNIFNIDKKNKKGND